MSQGLSLKRYWRYTLIDGKWHCYWVHYIDNQRVGYISLCGRYTRERSGGQRMQRPKVSDRCAICDGDEIKLTGADESLPENHYKQKGGY